MCCSCFDSYLQISKREGKKARCKDAPWDWYGAVSVATDDFSSHVRMNRVISNSECIWASLASQSCVKYKVNIVRKSDKKKAIIKSSSSSYTPPLTRIQKDILAPAFSPGISPPSTQHPAKIGSISQKQLFCWKLPHSSHAPTSQEMAVLWQGFPKW